VDIELPQAIIKSTYISEITQLILREREFRDTAQWDAMRECFHRDSVVRISWFNGSGPEFVDASIDMARRQVLARHRLSPIRVNIAGNRAIALLYGIIDIPTRVGDVELILSAHGRFIYRVERRDNEWKIFGFDCVYLRDELTPAVAGQSIDVDPEHLGAFRPSYQNLSYCLHRAGYEVDQNLPGEDRPETANALMNEVQDWLLA
jgi:SnoaL-like domain